mgnify:CR=1 FL=1
MLIFKTLISKKYFLAAFLWLLPAIVSAEEVTNLFQLLDIARSLVNLLTGVVAAIVLLVFFWGMAKFVLNAGELEARVEGRRLMFWGIIALFVMVSVWGILYFIGQNLGIGQGGSLRWGPPF